MRDRRPGAVWEGCGSRRQAAERMVSAEPGAHSADSRTRKISNGFARVSLLVPRPRSSDNAREVGIGGRESKFCSRGAGVGDQIGRVSRPSWLEDVRHLSTCFERNGRQNLPHGKTVARAKVENAPLMSLHQQVERRDMRGG